MIGGLKCYLFGIPSPRSFACGSMICPSSIVDLVLDEAMEPGE